MIKMKKHKKKLVVVIILLIGIAFAFNVTQFNAPRSTTFIVNRLPPEQYLSVQIVAAGSDIAIAVLEFHRDAATHTIKLPPDSYIAYFTLTNTEQLRLWDYTGVFTVHPDLGESYEVTFQLDAVQATVEIFVVGV